MGDLNTQKNQKSVSPLDNKLSNLVVSKDELVLPSVTKTSDPEVTLSKNQKGAINIVAPAESELTLVYKIKDSEGKVSKSYGIQVDKKESKEHKYNSLSYSVLEDGQLQVVTSKNIVGLGVIVKKESGDIAKVEILKTLRDAEVKSNLPDDIKEIAKNKNYDENLIKKNQSGIYTFCQGDICIPLGKSKFDIEPKKVEEDKSSTAVTSKPDVSSETTYSAMTSNDARLYLQNNPKENIFIIVTATTYCPVCQEYEPRIGPISKALKGVAKIIVVDEKDSPSVMSDFKVDSIPRTLLFHKDRPGPFQYQVDFKGPQVLENLKEKLNLPNKIKL